MNSRLFAARTITHSGGQRLKKYIHLRRGAAATRVAGSAVKVASLRGPPIHRARCGTRTSSQLRPAPAPPQLRRGPT
jgi:hypothetical protein